MQKFLIGILLKKFQPQLVFVWGNYGRMSTRMMIASVLQRDYDVISGNAHNFEHTFWNHCGGWRGVLLPKKHVKKIIAVLECEPQEDAYHVLKKELPVRAIVVTPSTDIPGFADLFSGEESSVARFRKEITRIHQGTVLVLNYDDEAVRSLGEKSRLSQATYGVSSYAKWYAGEIKSHVEFDDKSDRLEAGMYAKVHTGGNMVPFHIPHAFGRQHIYAALAALIIADCFDMNIIEAIEGMQRYGAPEGNGNIRVGMKGTVIVDASSGATPFFVRELLDVAERIKQAPEKEFRVVVVLGDIIGFGEGDEEAQLHKTLGEYTGRIAQEVYLVGERVVFTEEIVAQELAAEYVHRFDNADTAAKELERNLKKGDMIFIFGTPGVDLKNVVEQICEKK